MTKQRNNTDWRSTNRRKNSKLPLVPRNQVRPRKLTHTHNIILRWSANAEYSRANVGERTRGDDEGFCLRFHQSNVSRPVHPEHRPPPAARTTVLLCQRLLVLPENGYRMIICNSDFLFAIRRCRLGGGGAQ
jgi:hypothetical protein